MMPPGLWWHKRLSIPQKHYFIEGIIYLCTNIIILFASLYESNTQYNCAYTFPPGSAPVHLVTPPCDIDLEFFYPHHLDLPPGYSRGPILTIMKEIASTPPLPIMPPALEFSKLGFVYIAVLGLANQVVPHTRSWRPLATAVNYIFSISPIGYMAFQDFPASPVGVQPNSGMGCDRNEIYKYTKGMILMIGHSFVFYHKSGINKDITAVFLQYYGCSSQHQLPKADKEGVVGTLCSSSLRFNSAKILIICQVKGQF
ncbi:hypothetical protein DSO57_1025289 [Entomophthora muscae]|uniref:Uncharacterized protein n=1 Tax=Entomophthora muscae TaxID=34485 RepID=A0ACC2UNN9_9FUNG|nr:hypothetical protein DSO57_1025289 [Entomophthora muscae]